MLSAWNLARRGNSTREHRAKLLSKVTSCGCVRFLIATANPIQWSVPFLAGMLALLTVPAAVHADTILDYQFSGEIAIVDDEYGLFSQIGIGDSVTGVIRLCDFDSFFDDRFGYAEYGHSVANGNRLSTSIAAGGGPLNFQAPGEFLTQVYGPDFDPFVRGVDFQSLQADISLLDLTGLPAGFYVSQLGFLTSFLTSDGSLSSYPNLPTTLHNLDLYDVEHDGFIYADVRNSTGGFEGFSITFFNISSMQSVPEPSSFLFSIAGLVVIAVRRRRTACQFQFRSGLTKHSTYYWR